MCSVRKQSQRKPIRLEQRQSRFVSDKTGGVSSVAVMQKAEFPLIASQKGWSVADPVRGGNNRAIDLKQQAGQRIRNVDIFAPEKLLATLPNNRLRGCRDIERLLLLARDVQKDEENAGVVHLDEVIEIPANSSHAIAGRDSQSCACRQNRR